MKIEIEDFIKQLFVEHRTSKSLSSLGIILLFLVYGLDNWFKPTRSEIFSWNYSSLLFYLGIGLFILGLISILINNLSNLIKIVFYRIKYPIKLFDKKFHLISFSGTVFLFDNCSKTSHWISSWQTAQDLKFQRLWTFTKKAYKNGSKIKIRSGKTVSLDDYFQDKRILTGGIPGK